MEPLLLLCSSLHYKLLALFWCFVVAVSSMGGFLGRRGIGEGAESEELTVSKGGNVILSAEFAVVQPSMSTYVFS